MPVTLRTRLDEHQRIARLSAGLEMPREIVPKPKRVEGLVPITCNKCGCAGARVMTQDFTCAFCGTVVPKPRVAGRGFRIYEFDEESS